MTQVRALRFRLPRSLRPPANEATCSPTSGLRSASWPADIWTVRHPWPTLIQGARSDAPRRVWRLRGWWRSGRWWTRPSRPFSLLTLVVASW